jgi:hypothetical protein
MLGGAPASLSGGYAVELEYTIETVDESQFVIQFLEDKLYQYNSDRTNKHDGRLFSTVVRDSTRTIIGGVAGWTWAYACEITQLWVAEGQGTREQEGNCWRQRKRKQEPGSADRFSSEAIAFKRRLSMRSTATERSM